MQNRPFRAPGQWNLHLKRNWSDHRATVTMAGYRKERGKGGSHRPGGWCGVGSPAWNGCRHCSRSRASRPRCETPPCSSRLPGFHATMKSPACRGRRDRLDVSTVSSVARQRCRASNFCPGHHRARMQVPSSRNRIAATEAGTPVIGTTCTLNRRRVPGHSSTLTDPQVPR